MSAKLLGRAGKYLTFGLDNEIYGIEILKVKEIMGVVRATIVPKTHEYIRGVINLRGAVIPVIELRRKFLLEPTGDTAETCIIVVQITLKGKNVNMGIVVDSVSEVLDIKEEDVEDRPEFGVDVDADYILGMAKTGGGVKILLDIEKVVTTEDMSAINEIKG
jgi:purine-binding chemotaxis protein CheW